MCSFVRSAARVYCTRSLVPIEKKSTSRAKTSAMRAADGTSTIVPTGIAGLNGMPSSSKSSLTSASNILDWRSSRTVLTIGKRRWTAPSALALRIARNWVLNKPRLRRHNRRLRTPRNGLRSLWGASLSVLNLSAPRSSVRMTTGCPAGRVRRTVR